MPCFSICFQYALSSRKLTAHVDHSYLIAFAWMTWYKAMMASIVSYRIPQVVLNFFENGMGLIDPNGRVSIFPIDYARESDVSASLTTIACQTSSLMIL